MRTFILILLAALLSGCVTTSGCYREVCAEVTSFLRPLAAVTYERDGDGVAVSITYSKEQLSIQAIGALLSQQQQTYYMQAAPKPSYFQ